MGRHNPEYSNHMGILAGKVAFKQRFNILTDSVPGGVAVGDDVQHCSTLINCSSTILPDLDLNHLVPSLHVSIDKHWV